MGVSFRNRNTEFFTGCGTPPSPIHKPRLGREGGLCSGVTLLGLAWAEFWGRAAVQSTEAGLCGLVERDPHGPSI